MSPILGGSLNFGTNGLMRLTADVDEPIKALGDGAAFRLNLMGEQTGLQDATQPSIAAGESHHRWPSAWAPRPNTR